jgi:hypothetical protein
VKAATWRRHSFVKHILNRSLLVQGSAVDAQWQVLSLKRQIYYAGLAVSLRVSRTLVFCILAISSLLLVYGPRPVAAATIGIPITIKGLSPKLSTSVIIDGKEQGTIAGGSTKSFNVDKSKPHTFEVDAEVKGNCATYEGRDVCTRYTNANKAWTLNVISTENCQQVPVCYDYYSYCDYWGYCWYEPHCTYETQCWTTTELAEKGHTFAYEVENQVVVLNPHGQNTDTWSGVDQTVSLTAEKFVVTRDESNVKERDVFVHWVVNGAPMEGNTLTIKSDKPLYIRAEYRTETSYRVRVSSEFGNPTMDSVDGWYMKGQEATISVEKEVPLEGIMGALGSKEVFVAWHSPRGVESRDSTYAFTVQDAASLQAQWTTDNSQPMTILGALVVAVVVVLVILALYRTGRLFRPRQSQQS